MVVVPVPGKADRRRIRRGVRGTDHRTTKSRCNPREQSLIGQMPLSGLHVPAAPSRRNLQARFTPSHRDCKLHSVAVPARRARLTGISCQRTYCKRYTHLLIHSKLYTYRHNNPDSLPAWQDTRQYTLSHTSPAHSNHAIRLLFAPTRIATLSTRDFFMGPLIVSFAASR